MCRVTTRLFLTSDLYNIEFYSVILLCQSVRYSPADNHWYQMLVTSTTIYSSPVFWLFATVLVVGWKPEPVRRWIPSYAVFTANYVRPYEGWYSTFMWPCIVTKFFIIKRTRCTNFRNLFWHETLHVSDSSSVHHQDMKSRLHISQTQSFYYAVTFTWATRFDSF
jgi:hypothetical protein